MSPIADKSKPYMPLAGVANDGWSTEDEATATCFCGAVQLSFPTSAPGLMGTFICNCSDCHKITASMFSSCFVIDDTYLKHVRGRENMTQYSQAHSIEAGNTITNNFCSTCGSLMYRVGSGHPGISVLRIGTVDDFHLHETKLKPRLEMFSRDRVGWLCAKEGVEQYEGNAF